MKTLAEGIDEFLGLVNEAGHWLESMVTGPQVDREIQSAVLHQLVELCATALNTAAAYEERMAAARRVLENGTFQPLKDEGGTESHPDAGSAS